MANVSATPRSEKSASTANTPQEVRQGPVVYDGWKAELRQRIHVFQEPVETFLDTFVPCSQPYTPTDDLTGAFSQYQPKRGKEVKGYPGLITGLNTLVSSFDAAHKLRFYNTRKRMFPFPFANFAENHHASSPDISVGFPNSGTLSDDGLGVVQWQGISIAIEAKSTAAQDPFITGRKGKESNLTAIQLSRNARNILLAHGSLAVFVIGVYGNNVRIARYDHTCAVVSKPFSLKSRPGLLQRFFWHFVHPMIGETVVGCDPTVRKLKIDDQNWVKAQLRATGTSSEEVNSLTAEISKGRRVIVFNEADQTYKTYLLYHLIDVNARLFSRATTVWRAMEDTRPPSDGTSESATAQPEGTPAKTVIFKEAWRQLVRTPEVEFYKRMEQTFGDDETKWQGLARFVCGGDQGQEEVRQWERSSNNVSIMDGQRDLRLFAPTTANPPPPAASSTSGGASAPEDATFELPYPQHQTFSWTLAQGKEHAHRERSQIRIVVEDVGRPLTSATSTFEVVCAIMAAIEGHKAAWETAGIMHRDVSLGNILISTDPARKGFLHDFDYSSMEPLPPRHPSAIPTLGRAPSDDPRKERTGTYYYMAINILSTKNIIHGIHHDLESFYWVLMWIVMRHTVHSLGQEYCATLFIFGNDRMGALAKAAWLSPFNTENGEREFFFEVENNAPLTQLIEDFRQLIFRGRQLYPGGPKAVPLTYDSVLAIFRKAVARTDWPANDIVPCTLLKKTVETAIVGATGTCSAMGAQPAEDEGIDLDVDEVEEEDGDDGTMETVHEQGAEDEADSADVDEAIDDNPGIDNAPATDNQPQADDVVTAAADAPAMAIDLPAGEHEPQEQDVVPRPQAKRHAEAPPAPEPAPAPSSSGTSSKKRKTNPEPAPVARNGSGSNSRGKTTLPARRGSASGGRGRR